MKWNRKLDDGGSDRPSSILTADEIETDFGTVRIVSGGETQEALISAARHDPGFHPPSEGRTPMQKTQDDVLDQADSHATSAFEEATESLAWLELLVDLPKELRHTLPKLLGELQELIQNERRLRL